MINLLIIGLNPTSKQVIDYLLTQKNKYKVLAVLITSNDNQDKVFPFPVLTFNESVLKKALFMNVQIIYSTLMPNEVANYVDLSKLCRNRCIRLFWVSRFQESIPYPIQLQEINGLPIFSEIQEPLQKMANRMYKRCLDIVVSSMMILFCLSWMLPLFGIIICITSKGPILFCQQRTGINNRVFNCYKFRTMRLNVLANDTQAVKNDYRVTKFGKLLRRTSLDEFPQLLNVWLGQMSLVGPRPHMLKHTSEYSSIFGSYSIRHYVKPGITGWSQVNGFRGQITSPDQLKERIARDFWYIEHWSFWLDIKILCKTGIKMLSGDQHAY